MARHSIRRAGGGPDHLRTSEPFKIPIKTVPNLRDLIDGKIELSQVRSLSVDDLLTRAPIGLTRDPLKHLIGGRRVMVTGAGGSIGSELCRQIARLKPAALVMLERYENRLHAIGSNSKTRDSVRTVPSDCRRDRCGTAREVMRESGRKSFSMRRRTSTCR